jgi:hypothetical protein
MLFWLFLGLLKSHCSKNRELRQVRKSHQCCSLKSVHPELVGGFAKASTGSARTEWVYLNSIGSRAAKSCENTRERGSGTQRRANPKCVLSGVNKNAKILKVSTEARAFNYNADQGERWERVVCKLEQRRGDSLVSLLSPTRVLRKFAGDMSHCPSMLNKAHKNCYGLPRNLRTTTNCIDHGLFREPGHTT